MQITGIVLAGGKSSRMGTDKCYLTLGGNSLVEIALRKLQTLCSEVVISSNCSDYDAPGVKVIRDLITDSGPLAGIYSAMKETNAENFLVIPADLPFITTDFLKELVAGCQNYDAVVPRNNEGYIEPLAAYYNRACLPIIEESLMSGDFSVYKILKKLNVNYFKWETLPIAGKMHLFMNLNSPEDYRQAEEIFKGNVK